jgi:succinyl-diaminopimelate desuccinylase
MKALFLLLLSVPALNGQAGSDLFRIYQERYRERLVPLLCEAVAFPTEPGNRDAVARQAAWLEQQAKALGLDYRPAGPVTELELPARPGAPVLGLLVHGDVQPAGAEDWTAPPFRCTMRDGSVYGRGTADDKGPLVQALLAMAALRDAGGSRTYTVRLLVGSDEESGNQDIATYLASHKAPDLTLVLDSSFPMVVGEKAWDGWEVSAAEPYRIRGRSQAPWAIQKAEAGVAASIVPQRAVARLQWRGGDRSGFDAALRALCPAAIPEGYHCSATQADGDAVVTVTGKAAHSGMNIEGGRNALVFLARALQGKLAPCGAADLLDLAVMAGKDLHGGGLRLSQRDPRWGRYNSNVALLKPGTDGKLTLTINLRRIPPLTHQQIQAHLAGVLADFNRQRGVALESGGYFQDEPFMVPADAKLVRRLLAIYRRATGEAAQPSIAGGATYARRLPNAVAFGMWFPDKPYPGHDADEHIAIADLQRGIKVLLEALAEFTSQAPLEEPLRQE